MAEFEDEEAAGFEELFGLQDQGGVEFVAFFAAEECGFGFVVADLDGERVDIFSSDVGRIGKDYVEKKWRVTSGEWREGIEKVGFEEMDAVGEAQAGGVLLGDS